MTEAGNKICYSAEARQARETDLRNKFGPDAEIYEPENVAEAKI